LTHDRRQRLRSDRGYHALQFAEPIIEHGKLRRNGAVEHLTIATRMYHEMGMTAARSTA
jgi:hypothetical protein